MLGAPKGLLLPNGSSIDHSQKKKTEEENLIKEGERKRKVSLIQWQKSANFIPI